MILRALVSALSLCVVACTTSDDSSARPSRADIAERAGALVERTYRDDAPGGAVLIARGDTVLFRTARGQADVATHAPLRPDAVFRIGSVTKQFAAAGLLTLAEAGRVDLDAPLTRYLPGYPGGDQIIVRQLLNHTSGVRSYTSIPGYMSGPVQRDLTTDQLIDAFRNEPADFAPGERFSYNNSGYVLVGAIIEAVTGMPWHAYLDQIIFTPLGMDHTGYGTDLRLLAEQAQGYTYEGDVVRSMRMLSMTQPHAAGALVSTIDDLLIWNRALHEGRVLRNDSYVQMITPTGAAASANYGFGLMTRSMRGRQMIWHGGGIFGFSAMLVYLPGPDITVVVLENDDAANSSDSAPTLSRRLAAIALGQPYPDMTAIPVAPAFLQTFEGVYNPTAAAPLILRVVDGALTAQRGDGPRVPLTAIGADDFLYRDGFSRLHIERDAAGVVTGVRYFAGGEGEGVVDVRSAEPLSPEPVGLQLPRAALERLVGAYAADEITMRVLLDGDTLRSQVVGQPPATLRATSPTTFTVVEVAASLTFSENDGPAESVVVRQNGREIALNRSP